MITFTIKKNYIYNDDMIEGWDEEKCMIDCKSRQNIYFDRTRKRRRRNKKSNDKKSHKKTAKM